MNKKSINKIVILGVVSVLSLALFACDDVNNGDVPKKELIELQKAYNEDSNAKKILTEAYDGIDDNLMHLINVYVDKYALPVNGVNKEGNEIDLIQVAKDNDGAFIEFMAPWCPGCVDAVESLKVVEEKTGKKVLSLAVDANSFSELDKFIEDNNVTGPIYQSSNPKEVDDYSIQFIPVMFYIDGQGVVKGVFMPDDDIDFINKVIK